MCDSKRCVYFETLEDGKPSFMTVLSHRKSQKKPPEMTIEKAIKQLEEENEDTLISAASFIQNQCFRSAEAKKMVSLIT